MLNLNRRVQLLTLSNVLSWGLVALFVVSGFTQQVRTKFTEINAERINIIGTNNKPVLVLANRRLIPGPSMNGKDYPRALAAGENEMQVLYRNQYEENSA